MSSAQRNAQINVKLLLTLSLGLVILAGGALVGHRFRKRAMASSALSAGTEAFGRQDFTEASKQLRQYLSKFPDDTDALKRYAEANLAIRPVQAEKIGAAIGAYRRLLRQNPGDPFIWKQLVKVYSGTGQHNEAAYVCRNRLEMEPHDADAMFWLGRALYAQRKFDEAAETLTKLQGLDGNPQVQRRQVQACGLLSAMAVQSGKQANSPSWGSNEPQAFEWLNRAVTKHPDSAEAWAQRARFIRTVKKEAAPAWEDLDAAEAIPVSDPSVRLLIVDEWLQWNRADRARIAWAKLAPVDSATLAQFDIDPEAWTFARFSSEARLLLLENRTDEGAEPARGAESLRTVP